MESKNNIKFYPEHPSDEETNRIETTLLPTLEQDSPFKCKTLIAEFEDNTERFLAKYVGKRFQITGVVKTMGLDAHLKPSIQISDCVDGETYALLIFLTEDQYSDVKIGDTVVVSANYLVMSNLRGVVMKLSELVSVIKN